MTRVSDFGLGFGMPPGSHFDSMANSGNPEVSTEQKGVAERALKIFSLPSIPCRCMELTHLIRTSHTAELCGVYPMLLEHIFGWGSYLGWRLRSLRREFSALEADEIIRFLKADGPIIRLAYRLMGDPNLFYEFPLTALPVPLQRKIAAGEVPAFIASKLRDRIYGPNMHTPPCMSLNPFEYFFFYYAYVELNLSAEATGHLSGYGNMAESIYSNLLDDYLRYFVPTGDRKLPPLPSTIFQSESPTYMLPSAPRQSNNVSINEANLDRPTLFKASIFLNEGMNKEKRLTTPKNPSLESECWRTEVVLNTLLTMWLSVDGADSVYHFETSLPSVEMVKIIRVIVRHLHHFMNSVSEAFQHPLEEVKRNIFPMYQMKLYVFLRYLFTRWPLDNSFRIVYETWLSYIQPWRYSEAEIYRRAHEPGNLEAEINLDATQGYFVMDNILFYTYLFQQMLPRLNRLDISSIRNAHMLYRITKVYSNIENLKSIIFEIEKNIIFEPNHSSPNLNTGPPGANHSNTVDSFRSLSTNGSLSSFTRVGNFSIPALFPQDFVLSSLRVANAKQLIRELEGQDSYYSPLFSDRSNEQVVELIGQIGQALSRVVAETSVVAPTPVDEGGWSSWVSRIFGFEVKSTNGGDDTQDSNIQAERAKVTQFLNLSRNHLIKLFNLPPSLETIYVDPVMSRVTNGDTLLDSSKSIIEGGFEWTEEFDEWNRINVLPRGVLSPGCLEIIGNPDLAPLRSYEIGVFVSTSHVLSNYFNSRICPWAEGVYFKDTWMGRVARALLAQPTHYYDIKKYGPTRSVREKKYLPPRVNFRYLATPNLPYAIITIVFLSIFLGIRGTMWILVPFLLSMLYISLRIFFEPKDFLSTTQQEFYEEINSQRNGITGEVGEPNSNHPQTSPKSMKRKMN